MIESIYKTPNARSADQNFVEKAGNQFKIKEPGKLPGVCVGCGTESNLIVAKEKLRYVNPITIM